MKGFVMHGIIALTILASFQVHAFTGTSVGLFQAKSAQLTVRSAIADDETKIDETNIDESKIEYPIKLKVWPGNRPPKKNPLLADLDMDASFDRDYDGRSDMMETDAVNPDNIKWWEAYFPSEEEIEAASVGYDFENPEEWFEENAGKFILE
mmetsp:Transcript_23379/g.33979  ORF Transcript_23379/g.33979 Transcript_23379/m.33979 type:complete len:152 (-) Transcript_23379:259-714(-)|eukprot:CAMPEP_0113942854 /NCGR_PEP_ID=MMETSP1339-20121228/12760_1 /TAXON_ID=94617 /ORGANISM="Fibrocapsa japonica" /LENGTH=151 /DNA_ID=CAMNT_0000947509 /DNA_START=94 /DNA_END=549 /DNA_ORIENTATION=+ /assembly_acc=CAM_ASM_000762